MIRIRRFIPNHNNKHTTRTLRLSSTSTASTLDELRKGNRRSLAKLITLVESSLAEHQKQAMDLIQTMLRDRANSNSPRQAFRVGLSGPPGVGKSSFIEAFGLLLLKKGFKVAVLAVDPSSNRTGGSILGDKTRMIHLSKAENAYVRPTPARGTLGGVAKNTTEAILLCEEAGYNIILVETVGVGQSETVVEQMVDMFILLVPPAGGDELQGFKKGIVELADLIIVNKSDGDLERASRYAQFEYMNALKFLTPKFATWKPKVVRCSAVTQYGLENVWQIAATFLHEMEQSNELEEKRAQQNENWMWKMVNEEFITMLHNEPQVAAKIPDIRSKLRRQFLSPHQAATEILDAFFASHKQL